MASASGVSVKGPQGLVYSSVTTDRFVAVRLDQPFVYQAKNVAFVSCEIYNGVAAYQTAGMSLWYQGVFFDIGPGYGYPFTVVANWKYDGLLWVVDTF